MMSEKRSVKLVALTLALLAVMLLVIVAGCTVWRTCGKCTDCSGTTYFGLSSSESVSEAPPVAPTRAKDGFEAREPQTKAPYKTVVSLTTLPERLIHPSFLDKCLLLQEACSHDENCTIQINIPFYTMKHVPYVIPTSIQELQANKFHIYRDIQDVGPITKLMGALTNPGIAEESYIIIVDDDIPYKKDFVKLLQTSFDKNPGRHIHCMCNASIAGYKGFGFQKKLLMQMVDMTMPKECMRVDDDYIQFVSEKLEINAVSVPYYGDTSIYCSCDIHIHDDEEKSIQWSRLKYDDRTKITPECKKAFDVNTSSFYEGFTNINQKNYKDNYTIICARYKRNTDFLDDLSDKFDVKVVQKRINEPYDPKHVDHLVINKANEAASYLSYIVKYYHNLPNNMIFIHDENTSLHHSGKITENIKNWIKEYEKTDGYFEVNNIYCYNECKEYFKSKEYKDILHHLLPNFNLDAHKFDGKCCAQFIVSKKRVQGNSKEFYVRFLHWLIEHTQGEGNGDSTNLYSGFHTGRYAEWLWKIVFTHKPLLYEGFTNNVYTNYKNNDYQESNDLDLINDKNCEIITTYLANNNQISELRKQNIINNFKNRYNFNIDFVEGIKYKRWEKTEQFESTLNLLERFEKSNYTYGIICQDDFFPINNFLSELNRTVALLPDTWECLHLCPGFLWGRKFRDKSKIGQLNPEYYMDKNKFDYHTSGRFFINCDPKTYYEHSMWVGGPVAFIIKHTAINKFIKDYKQNFDNDDRALVRIFNINTFICRNPQLGYEEECGGTSLK